MIIRSIRNAFFKLNVLNKYWYQNYFKDDQLKVLKHSTFIQQRAYLSVQIIQQIVSRSNLQKIKDKSLVHSLKEIICNADEKFVKPFTKTQMLKLFKQPGIVLPIQIFTQARVALGSQNLIQNIFQQKSQDLQIIYFSQKQSPPIEKAQKDEQTQNNSQLQQRIQGIRVIFSPTYLVTRQIFKTIIGQRQKQFAQICYGHSGISKTFSVIFYWVLSNYIMAHIFRNSASKPAFEFQYRHLNLPKLIYWSIDKDKYMIKAFKKLKTELYKNLHFQLPQMGEKINKGLFYQFYQQKNVRLIMVIDQIHQFASLLRQKKQKSKQFKNMRQLIKICYNQVYNLIYFSSVGIEKQLFRTMNLTFKGNQSQLWERKILFAQFLAKQAAMHQIVDYFLFQLGRKFKNTDGTDWNTSSDKQSIELKKRLRQKGFKILKSQKNKFILTPLSIRVMLEQIDKRQEDLANELRQNIQNGLEKVIKMTISKVKQDFERIFNDFQSKVQEKYINEYHLIIYELYLSAGRALINIQNKQTDQTSYQINLDNLQIDRSIFERLLNQNLFYRKNGKVYSLVPPIFIYNMIQKKMRFHILKINQMKKQIFKKYLRHGGRGQFAESIFIQTLIMSNIEIRLKKNQNQQNYKIYSNFNQNVFSFCPIPKKEQNTQSIKEKFFFLNSFKKIVSQLQSTSSRKNQYYLCLPYKKLYRLQTQLSSSVIQMKISQKHKNLAILQTIKEKIDNTSKLIDFLFLSKTDSDDGQHSIVNLHAFDITTDIKNIKPKIVSFLEEFLNFQDRYSKHQIIKGKKVIFSLSYFVLSGPYSGTTQSLTKDLNTKFNNIIQFSNVNAHQTIINVKRTVKQTKQTDQIQNQNQQKKPLLLSSIGYFSLQKQKNGAQFINREQSLHKDVILFKQIMQMVTQQRKLLEQQSKKLKQLKKGQIHKLISKQHQE